MKDTNTPNRASNMEKAEGDRETDARNQEPLVERRPYSKNPTRVENQRTSDASTISNGGLGGGRPEGGATVTPERARMQGGPKDRAREGDEDPVMPADDSSLNTKI